MWCSTSNFVWSSCVSSSQMLRIITNIHFIFSHHHHHHHHQLCPSCAPSWTLLHFIFSDHQHCQPFFSPFHLLYSSTSSLCSHFIFSLHHMMNFVPIFPLLLSLPSSTMLFDFIFSLTIMKFVFHFPSSLLAIIRFFCFIFSPHPLFLLAIINFCSNFIFLSFLPSSTLFQFHLFSCRHHHQLCNVFPIFIFFLHHHHQDFCSHFYLLKHHPSSTDFCSWLFTLSPHHHLLHKFWGFRLEARFSRTWEKTKPENLWLENISCNWRLIKCRKRYCCKTIATLMLMFCKILWNCRCGLLVQVNTLAAAGHYNLWTSNSGAWRLGCNALLLLLPGHYPRQVGFMISCCYDKRPHHTGLPCMRLFHKAESLLVWWETPLQRSALHGGCFTKLNAHPQGHYIGIEKFIYWVFNGNFFGSQILQLGFIIPHHVIQHEGRLWT